MAEPPDFDPDGVAVLEKHRVDYVLIGGLAATLHGAIHTTLDTDITPSRDRDGLVRLAAALTEMDALRAHASSGISAASS